MTLSNEEFESLNDNFEGLKERYLIINKELMSTQLEKDKLGMSLDSFKSKVEYEMETIREENKEMGAFISKLKKEKRELKNLTEELEDRIEELSSNKKDRELRKLNRKIEDLEDSLEEQIDIVEGLEKDKKKLTKKVADLKQKLEDANSMS